jgi:hypothetical protein
LVDTDLKVTLLIGVAWPFLGLGFLAIHFGYLPSGVQLIGRALGLFLAGALSGLLFVKAFPKDGILFQRALIFSGYTLFLPVGLMAALIAPGPVLATVEGVPTGYILAIPFTAAAYGSMSILVGLGITAGLGAVASRLGRRTRRQPPLAAERVQVQGR